jgi:hypothetical protein
MPAMPASMLDRVISNDSFDFSIVRARPKEALARLADASPKAKSMQLWFCGLKDFSFLERFPKLKVLVVADWFAPTPNDLGLVPQLKALSIVHLPTVTDLGPLKHMEHIEELRLDTLPSWDASGKMNKFESIRPSVSMPLLRWFRAHKAEFGDGIEPLAEATKLKDLDLANHHPLEEVAFLAGRRPDIRCDLFKMFLHIGEYPCKKCGTNRVLLSCRVGPRQPKWLCPSCKKAYVDKYVAEFERVRAAAGPKGKPAKSR